MRRRIKRWIERALPRYFLRLMLPNQLNYRYNTFIKVEDDISEKIFHLYLREDSFMEKVIFENGLYGKWEKESLKIWAELSKISGTILDIGANTGIFSMIAQANNPAALIIAVEPVDVNFEVLSKNITKNEFIIKAEKIALSDKSGKAKMFMLKDRLNYMTSVNDDRYANAPHVKGHHQVVEIEVDIKPFVYLAEKYKLQKIDLIKIDVEGHEFSVLSSMLPYIEKHKPALLIEVIGAENAIALNKMFKNLGYRFISMDEINTSVVVDTLWDNNHHNFLVCNDSTIEYLIEKNLCVRRGF